MLCSTRNLELWHRPVWAHKPLQQSLKYTTFGEHDHRKINLLPYLACFTPCSTDGCGQKWCHAILPHNGVHLHITDWRLRQWKSAKTSKAVAFADVYKDHLVLEIGRVHTVSDGHMGHEVYWWGEAISLSNLYNTQGRRCKWREAEVRKVWDKW